MKIFSSKTLISIGVLLIAASVALFVYNITSDQSAEKNAKNVMNKIQENLPEETYESKSDDIIFEAEQPAYILNPEMNMPVLNVDGYDYIGTIEIPALSLKLPVISELSTSSLKVSPSRYKGSAYKDDLIIAAHNYKSHFRNIKNLTEKDEIIFTDMDGNIFRYEVAVIESLRPTDIDIMESGEWDLTLFTCTLGGQYRITVRCDRAEK